MDSLVIPLQEKLEEWKKGVINLEKEHLKGYYHYKFYLQLSLFTIYNKSR